MDIVGPLERSYSGNKYILVVCDYATRYPKAIPLKSIDTETIATKLMDLMSRVGILNEILTDQGSNFTSKLLEEIYKMLGNAMDQDNVVSSSNGRNGRVIQWDSKEYVEAVYWSQPEKLGHILAVSVVCVS